MPLDVSPPTERLLITAKDARTMLGIGKHKFRRWVLLGVIPSYVDPETGWRYYSRSQIIETAANLGNAS
ncbi:MAG TPA: hypothetical protein VNJ54_08390 [Plantibacter sp.]|uniref:hypothetical protein n=1 Tax=Plantibacter sp. TaxID=1871045 RepID=UPI002B8338C1|nr:hypothetical protein [Plantibacter sp.]